MTALVPTWRIGAIDLTNVPYLVQFGADHGAPENVTEVLQSLIEDGDIELSERTGNRTLSLPILIEGSDMAELAAAEAALVLECNKLRNDLYFDPGDGFGPPMVFTVFRGQVSFNRNDDYEQAGYRAYTLTFRALPFLRSVDEVTVGAVGTGTTITPTDTVVDSGSSAAGWTATLLNPGTSSITPSVVSGSVRAAASNAYDQGAAIFMTRTASVDLSASPYLAVDWQSSQSNILNDVQATVSGGTVTLKKVGDGPAARAGFTRTIFKADTAVGVTTALRVGFLFPTVGAISADVDQIVRTTAVAAGTLRQQQLSVEVSGAVRSPGILSIEHETSALGDLILYTYPDDEGAYLPAMRAYRVSGGSLTVSSSLVSGSSDLLDAFTTVVYEAKASAIPPGTYILVARMRHNTDGASATASLKVTAQTILGSNALDAGTSVERTFPITDAWSLVALGRLQLPTADLVAPREGKVRISVHPTGVTVPGMRLDELWLFNTTTGRLTMVSCGTGTPAAGGPANRAYVLPPTIEDPRPRVLVGNSADMSDAHFPVGGLGSWQFPELAPPRCSAFLVTTNAVSARLTLRHVPRWHTHAAS